MAELFNPFFTTKPAGEGTGLGLSISHDIVVKQYAGSIEIDTQPGEFTEIKIILPRAAASISWSRSMAFRYVRHWHKADIPSAAANVRYWGSSGHRGKRAHCPLMIQSRHCVGHLDASY